ncbi:MAG: hypothetical protein LC799_12030, partial [Actinobacteria bacterium]|nr:hypothetical protein [Actinomycetota bacterium]
MCWSPWTEPAQPWTWSRHITTLGAAPGRRVRYPAGFDLDERARTAIGHVPESVWEAVSGTDWNPRDPGDAGVAELTGLLRKHPDGDWLASWPADM